MKKTIPTTLSGILFYIEEDAFVKLNNYLESVKKYFASKENGNEIVSDIENRIGEQFSELTSKDSSERIVTLQHVEDLIASMGTIEDFTDAENMVESNVERDEKNSNTEEVHKKLFRNPDDVVIAGVASGLAAYFGIDPIIVRLIFVAVVFAGGSGFLIYIILWFIMPMAETSSDKLQMRGEKVTLESVSEIIKEKVNEVEHRGVLRKIVSFPFIVIGKVLSVVLPVLKKVIGFVISFATIIAIFAAVFATSVTLFNMNSPYVDFPLLEMGYAGTLYLIIVALFFAILIPLLFIFSLGIKLLSRKNMWNSRTSLSLLGVWFVALLTLGVTATKIVPEYRNFMETNPKYQEVTKDFELDGFDKITVKNNSRIFITEGEEFSVSAIGWQKSIDNARLEVKDGTLSVSHENPVKICIFCFSRAPKINVTLPKVTSIDASNSSEISSMLLSDDELNLKLSNSSSAKLILDVKNLKLDQENSSWVSLSGTTTSAQINLKNSSDLHGLELSIQDATINLENSSYANLFVVKSLNATLKNSSYLEYTGDPVVTQKVSNSSNLRKEETFESDF